MKPAKIRGRRAAQVVEDDPLMTHFKGLELKTPISFLTEEMSKNLTLAWESIVDQFANFPLPGELWAPVVRAMPAVRDAIEDTVELMTTVCIPSSAFTTKLPITRRCSCGSMDVEYSGRFAFTGSRQEDFCESCAVSNDTKHLFAVSSVRRLR